MLQFEAAGFDCNISHFITTRQCAAAGQEDHYASFNQSYYCGDHKDTVDRNRAQLCEALAISPSNLYVPRQIHEDRIRLIDENFLALDVRQKAEALEGFDALLTNQPGACVAVTTADCVPLLFYAPGGKAVGVAHAGWRGTVRQIAAKMTARMNELFQVDPREIYVGIGPSISKDAFEVGEEVVSAFDDSGAAIGLICSKNPQTGKSHIDLAEANRLQLIAAGIPDNHIIKSDICTYKENREYYSARRSGIRSGRFLTGILLMN